MRLLSYSTTYSWRLSALSASPAGFQKVAALPTPFALPEAVPRALPPPASAVTAPSTQGKRDGEREALREREREGVAVGEGGMLMAKLYATESQRQFALGSKRSSIIKPAGTAAMAVEKTNGEAALGQLLTPESEDQSTVSLARPHTLSRGGVDDRCLALHRARLQPRRGCGAKHTCGRRRAFRCFAA
jgi:hypothetical protein